MRKVLFRKFISQLRNLDSTVVEGTGIYTDFIHKGLFHAWGFDYGTGEGSFSIALIELPDGTVEEVLPTNLKFIE